MATPWKMQFGNVNLTTGAPGDDSEMPPETPFRLLVSGNFRGNRQGARPLAQRKPIVIDRDNFDEVLAKLSPSVTLAKIANGADLTMSFQELDDFEPDRLFKTLPVFDELRDLQSQLGKASTFQQAAAKVRNWATLPAPASAPVIGAKQELSGAGVLDQMLEQGSSQTSPESAPVGEWERFLRRIVQPQLVEKADPNQADYERVVEEAIGAQMRAILHHPSFQALEAAWRSVFLLVKRLPTDASLQIHVYDASLDEWRADLAHDDPRDIVFFREVVGRAADKPWAAFVSLETFGKSVADLEVLASMAILTAQARTPILAAASPTLAGCPSLAAEPDPRSWKPDAALATAWQMIRGIAPARYLGLVTPRFLLRLPYGKNATETESFAFEEMPRHDHAQYLWGSSAVLCALLLAEGFVAAGWDLTLDDVRVVNGLPVHVYDDDGESAMKPCAEVRLRETALEALTEQGLMVVASTTDRDSVRLHRFQSAAQPTTQLAGRW